MKTRNQAVCLILAALGAFWLAGCSTPASRIKANPEAFARLTSDQKTLVEAGQIDLGFDFDAVKLALGDPDRVTTKTDASGEKIIWHYVTYETDGPYFYPGYYHAGPWWGWHGYPYPHYPYFDYPYREERDRFRVEFENGKVTAITQELTSY